MGSGDEGPVENQYRTELEQALSGVRSNADTCGDAFSKVISALENGAWSSSTADIFDEELRDRKQAAQDDADDCRRAFETRHENEPEEVDEDDWRARWVAYPPMQMR
ncbi:hypothetical protein [Phytoactinopolyspora halophila]|uniref:Uncharacterized protein n=1 Tax=Phytoactinopolyspora halophila TaxID=1981511 RepID=A0A329R1Q5_9ACTN|nr:hypothetical protein [Phytoactinopolyspora halophila]RAW18545.1 hypothetical protein DPM12_00135 [Phytoactinopolyspora halophila]